MKEMILMMAAMLSKEDLLERLQEAMNDFTSAKLPTEKDEAWGHVETYCLLISLKKTVPTMEDLPNAMMILEKSGNTHDLIEPSKN